MNERDCRRIVNGRADGRCERCARWGPTTIHHRHKQGQGGPWNPQNCVALCGDGTRGCHGWCEQHPDLAEADGFHVRPWQDFRTTPVLWRWALVCLNADGTLSDASA